MRSRNLRPERNEGRMGPSTKGGGVGHWHWGWRGGALGAEGKTHNVGRLIMAASWYDIAMWVGGN